VDLNELLYAHQLAVMKASAPHASLEDRERYLEEAGTYSGKIQSMPGSLDISGPIIPGDAELQSPNPGDAEECPPSRTGNIAGLSAWESEGGAIAAP
jgi:hypothetical protein